MNIFIKYLSHIAFASALAYFGFLAFVAEKDPMTNKMIMIVVGGLWVLWIFAKSLIKMAVLVALIGTMLFAGYYVIHAKEIECKNAGRHWNKELQICEDKKTIGQKLKSTMSDVFKTTLKKWTSENIKVEKTPQKESSNEKKK